MEKNEIKKKKQNSRINNIKIKLENKIILNYI